MSRFGGASMAGGALYLLLAVSAFGCSRPENRQDGAASGPGLADADAAERVAHAATKGSAEEEARATRTRMKASGQLGPGRGTLIIDLGAPPGAKLTEGAPLKVAASGKHLRFPEGLSTKLDPDALPIRLPVDVADGATGSAEVELTYYYCTSGDDGSCQPEHAYLTVELDLTGEAAGGEAHFRHSPRVL